VAADPAHSNQHLTGAGLRRPHFFDPKNFRTAKFMRPNRLHPFSYLPSIKHQTSDIKHQRVSACS
jgi:hypothetical protein